MSIFRFSAEFRFFFFYFPLFWKSFSASFFLCCRQKNTKKSQSPTPPLSGEFKGLAIVGRVHRAPVRRCSLFRFLVKVRKRGISTRHSKSDTRKRTPPRRRKVRGVVRWQDGGGARNDRNWAGQCTLTIELQHLQPPPFPTPLVSCINLHRHVHTRSHTHTHTHTQWIQTHTHTHTYTHTQWNFHTYLLIARICLSLSLSLFHTHTEKIFHAFLLTNTHACTAVSVASSEHAKNSMTRISPYFNPSPFPLVPLQPTTAVTTTSRQPSSVFSSHQFFLTIRVEQSHLSA